MSRIGKLPIPIPDGVTVDINDSTVKVTGPKGELTQSFNPDMEIAMEDGTVVVRRPSDQQRHRALHGLTRALIANMVAGVSTGYKKVLVIVGVGYRAEMVGQRLNLIVGFSHPILVTPPPGITFTVESPTRFSIEGINKQLVGEIASQVRAVRPPEPYKGKGIRFEGEYVRRKAGKTAA
ncbi:MAG: 50S ribosomal protein L6 [candidate division Zixibacteria bacterium]|nr:50S ribosomal protein L6 [candidate division Zixibacteria bacterium]